MGRAPPYMKKELKEGPWSPEEDQKLIDYIQKNGLGSWRSLPTNAGLSRCGKSCKLRWMNYLRPGIKRGRFSFEEEKTIIQLHQIFGNNWSVIAARLPGRTDAEIKNYWNSLTSKKLQLMGTDSTTHDPSPIHYQNNSLLFNHSLFNPTQLLISRLLGLKTILNLKLLTMNNNILSTNTNQNTLQHQEVGVSHFRGPFSSLHSPIEEMIPGDSNALTTQWQDAVTSFDVGNGQSLLDFPTNLNSASTYFDGNIEEITRSF